MESLPMNDGGAPLQGKEGQDQLVTFSSWSWESHSRDIGFIFDLGHGVRGLDLGGMRGRGWPGAGLAKAKRFWGVRAPSGGP
jgi:hypothetical protein